MRDRFLGDSLDLSKRVTLGLLRQRSQPTLVVPLPSTRDFDFPRYRQILDLREPHVLFDNDLRFRLLQRRKYLDSLRAFAVTPAATAFSVVVLDPDKGARRHLPSNLFLTVQELVDLRLSFQKASIAVYHHRNAGRLSYAEVLQHCGDSDAWGYNFGAAALLFLSEGSTTPLKRQLSAFSPTRLIPAPN